MIRNVKTFLVVAGVAFAGAALAGDLPNLPEPLTLPMSGDSPGAVTFNHETHVDTDKPRCLSCHAESFRILGRSSPAPKTAAITHTVMEQGQSCGACHGKEAFGFDDCSMCHAE